MPFVPKLYAILSYVLFDHAIIKITDKIHCTFEKSGINAVFHYLPLHLSPMGKKFNEQNNNCPVTEKTANRIIRLPFYTDLY